MFKVRIEPQGRDVLVRADQSVLDAALVAGLNLPHSCKSGHCGSCRARLISGAIDYPLGQPLGITQQESAEGAVLLCRAQARSHLIIASRVIARAGTAEIKTLPCRVEKLTLLAPDVMQLMLRLPAVEHLEFKPGQYLDVLLDRGRRRSFSIACPPHDSKLLELHLARAPGAGFTAHVFEGMRPGELLRIEGPLGQFIYEHAPAPLLLVAGGTGFAPIKSILRHVLETGLVRPIHLYWGARTAEGLYEERLVQQWRSAHDNSEYSAVLSESDARGPRGWVHERVASDYASLDAADIYAAGPPAMIVALRQLLADRKISEQRLRFDSFDAAPW